MKKLIFCQNLLDILTDRIILRVELFSAHRSIGGIIGNQVKVLNDPVTVSREQAPKAIAQDT